MRRNRDILVEKLKSRYGDRCCLCGAEGVPLEIHHFLPLSEGGTDSFENSILVCPRCHRGIHKDLTEFDFATYLVQLLHLNEKFKNVRTNESYDTERRYIADIVAEEYVDGEWQEIVFECKFSSSFTESRLQRVLDQLSWYRSFADLREARFVFAFPGKLDSKNYARFKQLNIEIWDLVYISNRFKQEILKVYHPGLQAMFLAKKPSMITPEQKLIQDLKVCKPGKAEWSKYQKLVGQILERLFCPPLSTPISELSDLTKVNRRDFILPNYSEGGFWAFIRFQYSADYIIVDAKNYVGKIKKQSVLQISNYLKKHGAGLFGLIICRKGGNRSCTQTLREVWAIDRKLVVVLTDDDVEKMLLEKSSGREPEIIIRQKIEDFRLTL